MSLNNNKKKKRKETKVEERKAIKVLHQGKKSKKKHNHEYQEDIDEKSEKKMALGSQTGVSEMWRFKGFMNWLQNL